MKVKVEKLLDFLQTDGMAFSIPLFQRPYSWDSWQCEVLWNDIERTALTDTPLFFGAVFYRRARDDVGGVTLSLIDGQQRTLTSLLLLAALRAHLKERGLSDDTDKPDRFAEHLHIDGGAKVHPAPRDRVGFAIALDGAAGSEQPCNALSNKAFFMGRMAEPGFDACAFLRGLGGFQIVAVELEDGDDAQSIFESFNSKGVPLVAADMVRNYLLLAEDPEEQERLYLDYWEPIQGLFGDDPGSLRLNNALRAWTVIRCKTPKAKSDAECFGDFKRYLLDEYDGSKEDLMQELLSFCTVWAENYRYHAVKKYRSSDWAKIGRKTLVSGRPRAAASREAREFYAKHYGVEIGEDEL